MARKLKKKQLCKMAPMLAKEVAAEIVANAVQHLGKRLGKRLLRIPSVKQIGQVVQTAATSR